MHCKNCKTENSDSAKFCKNCGSPFKKLFFTRKQKIITAIIAGVALFVIGGSFAYFYRINKNHADGGSTSLNQSEQNMNPDDSSGAGKKAEAKLSKKNTDAAGNGKAPLQTFLTGGNPKDYDYSECPDPKAASCIIQYHDPGSGETVEETPNQTPELAGRTNNIVYLGFAKLIDIGVSFDQVNKLRAEFLGYSSTQKTPIEEISITINSIRDTVDEGNVTLTCSVTIDRSSAVNAKIQYFGIGDPTLKLYDPNDGTQVYSSN